jgi:hypothetical protein
MSILDSKKHQEDKQAKRIKQLEQEKKDISSALIKL